MQFAPTKARTKLSIAAAMGLPFLAAAGSAAEEKPYAQPDGSFISLSGTVVEPGEELFELDYGEGTITVEMDDWDSYGEARALMDGDTVTVYGRIDDDFFERTKIEAGAVYVRELNTYFYASSMDEESLAYLPQLWATPRITPVSEMTVRGEVLDVDAKDRTFTVDLGVQEVVVDTRMLGYNPLDDRGFQRIDEGDWVTVSGDLDFELIDGRVLNAKSLTTLIDDAV